jgi:hypothetical protein
VALDVSSLQSPSMEGKHVDFSSGRPFWRARAGTDWRLCGATMAAEGSTAGRMTLTRDRRKEKKEEKYITTWVEAGLSGPGLPSQLSNGGRTEKIKCRLGKYSEREQILNRYKNTHHTVQINTTRTRRWVAWRVAAEALSASD